MKKATIIMAILVLSLATAVSCYAQAQGGGRRGQGGPGGGFDRSAMQERMNNMMKEQLEITDEEWTIVGPRLNKVMTLSRESRMGGMGRMMRGRRGGMGGPGGQGGPGGPGGEGPEGDRPGRPDDDNEEQSAVEKASDSLATVLESETATSEQVKEALTKLRAAKEAAKQELIKAQEELKEVLTLKQEAKLVMFGMLD